MNTGFILFIVAALLRMGGIGAIVGYICWMIYGCFVNHEIIHAATAAQFGAGAFVLWQLGAWALKLRRAALGESVQL